MICDAEIRTSRRADGGTALTGLRSSPPLALMPTPAAVYIVGSAAGPLNGDRIALDIEVAPGTKLTIRTVAAAMAWPGTSPVPSQFIINARVGEGAELAWLPQPFVPIKNSRHRMAANVELCAGAAVVWREEIVLGRYNEPPGDLSSRIEIEGESGPILRQDFAIGPDTIGYMGAAVAGQAKAVGSITLAGNTGRLATGAQRFDPDADVALLELERDAVQICAAAPTAERLRRLLDQALTQISQPNSPSPSAIERSPHVELNH